MRVYLTEYLCPRDHLIAAEAFEATHKTVEGLTLQTERLLLTKLAALHYATEPCVQCKAPRSSWKMRTKATRWHSIEEAIPHLQQLQRQQDAMRAFRTARKEYVKRRVH